MISPELLRRYSFFSGFTFEQLDELAMAADESHVRPRHYFFEEGETLNQFYFLIEGSINLTYNIPDHISKQTGSMHITGDMITRPIVIGSLGDQEMFGWSALVPPNNATAGAQAGTDCRVISFNTQQLRPSLDADCGFGHLLTLKTAQTIRERLRMRRIQSLVEYS